MKSTIPNQGIAKPANSKWPKRSASKTAPNNFSQGFCNFKQLLNEQS